MRAPTATCRSSSWPRAPPAFRSTPRRSRTGRARSSGSSRRCWARRTAPRRSSARSPAWKPTSSRPRRRSSPTGSPAARATASSSSCSAATRLPTRPPPSPKPPASSPTACPARRSCPPHRRGNLRGALDMGLAPGLLPGRVTTEAGADWFAPTWGPTPKVKGLDTAGMLAAAAEGTLKALVLLGADPLSDFPDQRLVEAAFAKVEYVVAVEDHCQRLHRPRRRHPAGRRIRREDRHHHQHRGPRQPGHRQGDAPPAWPAPTG